MEAFIETVLENKLKVKASCHLPNDKYLVEQLKCRKILNRVCTFILKEHFTLNEINKYLTSLIEAVQHLFCSSSGFVFLPPLTFEKIIHYSALLRQTRLSDYEITEIQPVQVQGYENVKQPQHSVPAPSSSYRCIISSCGTGTRTAAAAAAAAYILEQLPFLCGFIIITRDKFHKGTDV